MSAKKDQEYFSDGLAEALIDLLTQVQDLRVPARTSSFSFKGKSEEIATIAQKLRVAHILEGSVRKAGSIMRVTAHLIRADDGYHVWSKTYDRDLKDIFKVQDEIATVVVDALKAQLLPAQRLVNQHRTTSTEAYEQYLLGRQFYNRHTVDGLRLAAAALQQAIALDPDYASAHAMLALPKSQLAHVSGDSAQNDAEAIAAADRAVALAPGLAEAYSARGWVRMFQWDWTGAVADLEKAMELDPRDSASQRRYGMVLTALGRYPEAIAAAQTAIELEPLDVNNWVTRGISLSAADQYAAAREALTRALELSPESFWARSFLTSIDLLQGQVQEALSINSKQEIEPWRLSGLALVEYKLGHAKDSQQVLDKLIANHRGNGAYTVAQVYALRGETDKAFEWLDRACRQHEFWLSLIRGNASFAGLRGDPRYSALLRKMNLPE